MTTIENHTVTWEAPDRGQWTVDASHGVGVTAVAMRRELEDGFADGFRESLAKLGMPLSHIEIRHVNDYGYNSVFVHEAPRSAGKPPPAFVLKLLSRLHPKARARTKVAAQAIADRTVQGFATTWAAERAEWIDRILDHQRVDPASLDDDALAAHLERGAAMGAAAFRRHFALIAGCVPFGEWLLRAEAWGLDAEQARQAVMFGTAIHTEATARLRRIRVAIGPAAPSSLGEVRAVSAEAGAALDDYLEHHGCWVTEDEVCGRLLLDFPDLVLRSIMATSPTVEPTPTLAEALEPLRARVPAADHDEFDRLAADAHAAHRMLDDNSGILGSWALGVVSRDLRAAATRLVARGRLEDPAHVWVLTTQDVVARLRGLDHPTVAEAAERYADWRRNDELDPPAHLNGEPSPPPDPAVFPAPVAHFVAAIGAFLGDKFNDAGTAQGIGDSPVTGRAVVVASASDALDRIEPGDILVTTSTTPAFNGVLSMVGGLVVSLGGPSCHAAVVAREMGIPTIVGYTDATTRIADGSTVTLDPARATVATA